MELHKLRQRTGLSLIADTIGKLTFWCWNPPSSMFCWVVESKFRGMLEIFISKASDDTCSLRYTMKYWPPSQACCLSHRSFFDTELIAANQETYTEAACRQEKIRVAQQVVVAVYDRQGRFLKFEEHLEGWVEVSDKTSRSKVCQAFKYRRQQDEQHPAALPESAAGHPARPRRGHRHR